MAPVPADAFRALLADRSRDAFAAFVADLWAARGRDVRREDGRLVAGREVLHPALTVAEAADRTDERDVTVVVASQPREETADDVLGPTDLHRLLLYDVPREEAAALFETHFDRQLDDDWTGASHPADVTGHVAGAGGNTDGTADEGSTSGTGAEGAGDGMGSGGASAVLATTGRRARALGAAATAAVLRRARRFRSLLGDRRVQVAVVAALAVFAAVGWGLFLHEPVPRERTDPPFDAVEVPPGDGSYRAVGEVRGPVDDSPLTTSQTVTYAPGDPAVRAARTTVERADWAATITSYRRGEVAHLRYAFSTEEQFRRAVEAADPDEYARVVESTRTVYRTLDPYREVTASPRMGGVQSVLETLHYERAGTTTAAGREAVRYVPTTGWVVWDAGVGDGEETRYVRAASGQVLVDAETGALLAADVEVAVVEADTWAEALVRPTDAYAVRYNVTPGVDPPDPEPWVEVLEADRHAGNATERRGEATTVG